VTIPSGNEEVYDGRKRNVKQTLAEL
jgi:hypothetical protein